MSTRQARPRQLTEPDTQEEIEQRESAKRWREESERRKRQEQAAQQQKKQQAAPAERPMRRVARTPRRRLFHDLAEVRRAIILSEVIGSPRALNELEPRG
jgi:hypothetical protein